MTDTDTVQEPGPDVDELVSRTALDLGTLDDRPTAEHPAAYERVQSTLSAALDPAQPR